ncbi:hypothetical protein NE237_004230 [Protea cynaroides]|uniref:Uncharacterized protein n=1 Tax=Protea cynaroides TaxID=273540 RepID=A0A9Q0KJ08_9MAGN|nr:hypothetical protein NE237_004230 [Protea cynaroides]
MARIKRPNLRLESGNPKDLNVESAAAISSGQTSTSAPATCKSREPPLMVFVTGKGIKHDISIAKADRKRATESPEKPSQVDLEDAAPTLINLDDLTYLRNTGLGGDRAEDRVEGEAPGEKRQAGKRRRSTFQPGKKKKQKPSEEDSRPGRFKLKVKLTIDTSAIGNLVAAEHLAWHIRLPVDIEAYGQLVYADAFHREICHHAEEKEEEAVLAQGQAADAKELKKVQAKLTKTLKLKDDALVTTDKTGKSLEKAKSKVEELKNKLADAEKAVKDDKAAHELVAEHSDLAPSCNAHGGQGYPSDAPSNVHILWHLGHA